MWILSAHFHVVQYPLHCMVCELDRVVLSNRTHQKWQQQHLILSYHMETHLFIQIFNQSLRMKT